MLDAIMDAATVSPLPPIPENEAERLLALHSLQLLDTASWPAVDALTRMVREHFGVQTATVSLIDTDRQWFYSVAGWVPGAQTPRRDAFCSWTVAQDALLEVPDTLEDPRFRHARAVREEPHIRFYAGVPLHVAGHVVGTLCMFGPQPRRLSEAERRLLLGMGEAVAALLEAQRVQREAVAMAQLLGSAVEEAYLFDLRGQRLLYATPGAAPGLGYSPAALRALAPQAISACYTREHLGRVPPRQQGDERIWTLDTTHQRSDGSQYAVSSQVTPAPQAGEDCVVVVARNVEAQKRTERELARQAHYDALTGLANRYLLEDRFASARERGVRQSGSLGIVVVDLNGFKSINDTLGHAAGDAVLIHTARMLEAAIRGGDTVARTGGDEFVVLLDNLRSEDEGPQALERLRAFLVREPAPATGQPVAASLGLAVAPALYAELDSLLAQADAAMYAEKGPGGRR